MTHRLVRHENPEGRLTPLLLLAELRTIDPVAELVYFGGNDWRLGAVRPTAQRERSGRNILAQQARLSDAHKSAKNIMLGHLLTQGFAQIAKYQDFGDVSATVLDVDLNERCTILENFRRRDWFARHEREETFTAALAASSGVEEREASQHRTMDRLHNDIRAHFRREIKGRTQFGHGGQTGGRGSGLIAEVPRAPLLTGKAAQAALGEMMGELAGSF